MSFHLAVMLWNEIVYDVIHSFYSLKERIKSDVIAQTCPIP